MWDEEAIEIGGTPIYYYEHLIQGHTIDPLYVEERNKMWSNVPVCLYAYYDPIPSQNAMTTFGIDSPDELMFQLNYQNVLARIGHMPKIGSRIYTPHKRENWKIIQRGVEEFKLWGQLRLQIMCERFQDDLVGAAGKVTQPQPDFSVDVLRPGLFSTPPS